MLIFSLAGILFACGRAPVTVSQGEVIGGYKTILFYAENSRSAVATAFYSVKTLVEAEPGKVLAYRPLNTPGILSGTSAPVALVIVLTGATQDENAQLRSRLETNALLQAFSPLAGVELSPRGLQSEFTGLPYVVFAIEKRHLSFNRFPINVKDELIAAEERDLHHDVPAMAINSNLCLTNDFCDSLRIAGLAELSALYQFGVNGSYLRNLRKADSAVFFVTRAVDFKAPVSQF